MPTLSSRPFSAWFGFLRSRAETLAWLLAGKANRAALAATTLAFLFAGTALFLACALGLLASALDAGALTGAWLSGHGFLSPLRPAASFWPLRPFLAPFSGEIDHFFGMVSRAFACVACVSVVCVSAAFLKAIQRLPQAFKGRSDRAAASAARFAAEIEAAELLRVAALGQAKSRRVSRGSPAPSPTVSRSAARASRRL
jgi:hypothetical protein